MILACSKSSQTKNFLPEKLNNLILKRKPTGEETRAIVNRLHMKQVTAEENEIGFYEGPDGPATFYGAVSFLI